MDRSKTLQPKPKPDRKIFGSRIPSELAKSVRILSIKEDISVQDLMIEALTDMLIKHGEKPQIK